MTETIHHNTYSHNFGILIPQETGVTFTHQAGGMMCTQKDFEGVFLPLRRPTKHLGSPDWLPSGTDAPPIADITFEDRDIPERDYESFPSWVKDRGHFLDFDEYFYWLRSDDVWWYGRRDMIEELRLWNYDPTGDLLDRPMNETYDSLDHVWEEVDSALQFEYEVVDSPRRRFEITKNGGDPDDIPVPDGYPQGGEAIKWIRVLGSKEDSQGRIIAGWAENLSGEVVCMLYPNCD